MMNIYKENGYDSREDYLECLAEDNGVDIETVLVMADTLGPNEDFDGLVCIISDI